MLMGFALRLTQDLIEVEAGGNSPVSISIRNNGEVTDRFELEIEGLDPDWKAVPVPTFTVESGETHSERAFLKPPRVSESLAGNYPFVVRVRSLESGEQKTVQGVLQLKPFHYLTMEVNPKKGLYSWFTHRNDFEIKLSNLGNTEHTLQLTGGDPEDVCTYAFAQERVTISPGQQNEASVKVSPVTSPILGGSKLIGFSIQARSVDVPSVAAAGQAQLERRSLLSPANLALVLLLAIFFGAWILMKPKPPHIDVSVNPIEGVPGDKVVVSWESKDADHITIFSVDASNTKTQIYDGAASASSQPIVLSQTPGNEAIFAMVSKGGAKVLPELKATIKVDPPVEKLEPIIDDFHGSTDQIRVPGDVVFTWSVRNCTKVALTPDFPDLSPDLGSQTVHFDSPGDKDYVLVAWSKDGLITKSKKWHVRAYEVSDANIVSFSAVPNSVLEGGTVTVSWNVVNATEVGLTYGTTKLTSLPPVGSQQVVINANTEFVLTATDSHNRVAKSKVGVKLTPISVPPPIPPPGGPPTGPVPSGNPDGPTPSTAGGPPSTTTG